MQRTHQAEKTPGPEGSGREVTPSFTSAIGPDGYEQRLRILQQLEGRVPPGMRDLFVKLARAKSEAEAESLRAEFENAMLAAGIQTSEELPETPGTGAPEAASGADAEGLRPRPRPEPSVGGSEATESEAPEAVAPAVEESAEATMQSHGAETTEAVAPESAEAPATLEALEDVVSEITQRVGYEGLMRSLSGADAQAYTKAFHAYRAAVQAGNLIEAQAAYVELKQAADALLQTENTAHDTDASGEDSSQSELTQASESKQQEKPPVQLDDGGNVVSGEQVSGPEDTEQPAAPAEAEPRAPQTPQSTDSGWTHYKEEGSENSPRQPMAEDITPQPSEVVEVVRTDTDVQEAPPQAERAPGEPLAETALATVSEAADGMRLTHKEIEEIVKSAPELSDLSSDARERILGEYLKRAEIANDNTSPEVKLAA